MPVLDEARELRAAHGEDLLISVLQLISYGATISTEDGVICYANPAEERLFGYGPGELAGRHVSVQNAYSDEENARIVDAVMYDLKRSGSWSGEWINRRKDGSVFITSSRIRSIDWGGRRHWLCIRQEDWRARLQGATGEEKRLAIAAEAAELGIWEWDIASNGFIYSARARAICGFPLVGDVTYEDVVRVTHPEDFPHTSAQAKRALDPAVRDRTPFEYRIVRPDGEIRWVRAFGYAVFADQQGETSPLRYIGTLEDITDRIAERLAEHEAARQVHLALESARMAVWSLDLLNRVLKPSREFNQLFGLDPGSEPALKDVEACYAPGERENLRASWQEALDRRAEMFETEFKILRRNEERWLQVRCEISYSADGMPIRAFGVIMDVSEQHQAQDALRESDARFREAADSAPAPVWMTDTDGKMEFGNRALAEFAGMSREAVMGDTWLTLIHPEDLAGVVEARTRAWSAGHVPYTFEARFRRADGVWRWLEVNSRARRDAAGQFRGYVGLAVDRTEAREALAVLAESEERFRVLADSAPVMIWMSDAAGRCLYLNAALRNFWNVEADDVRAFDWRETMHPGDEARIMAELARATSSADAFNVEGRYLRADGTYRVVSTRGEPRFSQLGEFLGMIGVNVDITDVVEARERQRLLLDELNHRVKNTLTVVQSLAKQTFRPEVQLATARAVFDARLSALAGAHTLLTNSSWENASLRSLVEQSILVCGAARRRIAVKGPDLVLTPKQALSIALALHELCTNAVKHGSLSVESGHVALEWRYAPEGPLQLEWRERGGPSVAPPGNRGFGSTLLERVLPRDVQGEAAMEFDAEGLSYRLTLPVGWPK